MIVAVAERMHGGCTLLIETQRIAALNKDGASVLLLDGQWYDLNPHDYNRLEDAFTHDSIWKKECDE